MSKVRVCDAAGNVIERHEHAGEFKSSEVFIGASVALNLTAEKKQRGPST